MAALAAAGYRGVTLDQVARNWQTTTARRPIVISFDNGYRSQYTYALPVLRRLGWPAVENLQLSGLPPAQGGLDVREVRSLVRAGWELDTQGLSHADLTALQTPRAYAAAFVLFALAIACFYALSLAERVLAPWAHPSRGDTT